MIKITTCLILALITAGCSCTKPQKSFEVEAKPLAPEVITKVVEKLVPKPVYGQLKQIENFDVQTKAKKNIGQILDQENERSRQRPNEGRFFNSITVFDYMPGTLYQVYAAPGNLTTILLQPGEEISNSIMSGDSVTWKAQVGLTGEGVHQRQVIYLKPLMSKRKTTMVIPTNRRVYHLELNSFVNSFMASVEWNYHEDLLVPSQAAAEANSIHPGVSPELLNFDYTIKKRKGNPRWSPVSVFDDGHKTFLKLPKELENTQIPAVFLVTREEKTQMVNYRYQGNVLIIDRLIEQMELRVGKKRPEIVRITRNGGFN